MGKHMGRSLTFLVGFALLLGACGGSGDGGGGATTTSAESPATSEDSASTSSTGEPTTTLPSASTTSTATETTVADPISAIPPECIEPFQQFLVGIEPAAAAYDFEGAGLHDWEQFTIALISPATEMITAFQQTTCLDSNTGNPDPAIYAAIVDWATQNAPGSVAWLEVQEEIQEMGLGSGDNCADFLDIHEAYVARGGTVFDLTRAERFHAYSTFGAINQWCDLRTAGNYTFRPDVRAFMVLES